MSDPGPEPARRTLRRRASSRHEGKLLCLSVIVAYLVFWNIDISVLIGGSLGSAIIAPARWVCIVAVAAVFGLCTMMNPSAGRNYVVAFIAFTAMLMPAVVLSRDVFMSTVEYVRAASVFMLVGIVALRPDISVSIARVAGLFSIAFVMMSLPFIELESIASTVGAAKSMEALRERSAGVATNANTLGFGAAVATAYGLFVGRRDVAGVVWRMAICAAALVCLLASGSRNSILVTVGLYLFFAFRRLRGDGRIDNWLARSRETVWFFVYIGILSIPVWYVLFIAQKTDMPLNSFAASDHARVTVWTNAIDGFLHNPIIGVGFGLNIAETFNPLLRGFNMAPYAHNALLNVACGAGLLGIVLLLSVLRVAITAPLRVFRFFRSQRRPVPPLVWFSVLVNAIVLLSAVVEGGLQNSYGVNAYFAVALGGLLSLAHGRSRQEAAAGILRLRGRRKFGTLDHGAPIV